MEVILLENIDNLGSLGDKVNVKAGYGRNYLVPQHKAVPATAANLKEFEAKKAELEKEAAEQLTKAQARAGEINAVALTLAANAGEEGKLFGSITVRDIADAAAEKGVEIDRSEIRLPDGPLRELGEFEVEIHLHPQVNAALKISVVEE